MMSMPAHANGKEMMLYYATVKTQKDGATDTVAVISATKKAVDDGSMAEKMAAIKVKAFELWKQDSDVDCWNFYIVHESRESFEAGWAGRGKVECLTLPS